MAYKLTNFAAWLAALGLFQVDVGVPVVWVLVVSLVFGLSLAAIALLAPYIANRSMLDVQREVSVATQRRLDRMEQENERLKARIDELNEQYMAIRARNDELELDLKVAYDRIVDLENELRNTGVNSGGRAGN